MITKRRITVNKSGVESLMRDFGLSRSAVFYALRYGTDSDTARAIREKAVNVYGGFYSICPN